MELVLLCIINAVLLMLLVIAFRLIRSGGSSDATSTKVDGSNPYRAAHVEAEQDEVIDLRERLVDVPDVPQPPPTMAVYDNAVFPAGGSPLPDTAFETVGRTAPVPPQVPAPVASPNSLASLSRSAIVIDSQLNGTGPAPAELLFSVIETLGGIGFQLTKDSPDYGLLKDDDDNTASIDLTKRHNGTDRISIAVDSPRAVESLAVLEIWHRSRLGSTDKVRLSARIR